MNLRPEHEREPLEVNLTPLIDVVFLLLIFFMVSTTFDQQAKLKVQLPEASAKAEKKEFNALIISIDAKGQYYVDDKQLVNTTAKTLKQALIKTIDNKFDTPVILKADANTPHHAVVTAMDTIAQIGLTKLSIATMESQ